MKALAVCPEMLLAENYNQSGSITNDENYTRSEGCGRSNMPHGLKTYPGSWAHKTFAKVTNGFLLMPSASASQV